MNDTQSTANTRRHAALMVTADPDMHIDQADTIAAGLLLDLPEGQRWSTIGRARALARRAERLEVGFDDAIAYSLPLPGEDKDDHAIREAAITRGQIEVEIALALQADWQAAVAGTPGMCLPVPAQRVDAR